MGIYIGYVEQRKVGKKPEMSPAVFYDYTPIGEIRNGQIHNLSKREQEDLLPASENHNLNFFYDWKKDQEKMRTSFRDHILVVFAFTADDLTDNVKANGYRNMATAYKVQAVDMLEAGKIRSLASEGIYYAVKKEDVHGDFYKEDMVDIGLADIRPGDQVLVEAGDQFWAGPYPAVFHEKTASWCVRPGISENGYQVAGYKENDLHRVSLKDPGKDGTVWDLIKLQKNAKQIRLDVRGDETQAKDDGQDRVPLQTKPRAEETNGYRERPEKEEYEDLRKRMEQMKAFLEVGEDLAQLQKKRRDMQREVEDLESHREHLKTETRDLETGFVKMINNPYEKMVDLVFDGFMSSKMLNAAAKWEGEQAVQEHERIVEMVNKTKGAYKTPQELIGYLCGTVGIARPDYDRNTIINIAICLTQSFLTVFYGKPGCGKTSICNIFGQVLGLDKFADIGADASPFGENASRYIPISVERGWTSKRDLIGYYNPLSKTFDKSNRRIYDALHQLDTEKRKHISRFPLLILLDEANLSPMEYYWSDFMNICDDLGDQSTVNLGENYVFKIPETLHFCATINNDHTTETMSPRLIDRAWVITLPRQTGPAVMGKEIPDEMVEQITWDSLKNAFIPEREAWVLSEAVQERYKEVTAYLEEQDFPVSPRNDLAVRRYWAAASKSFEQDKLGRSPGMIALDYAIAQRILPKIAGNGEAFEQVLTGLLDICKGKGRDVDAGEGGRDSLDLCAEILEDMIRRGNQQMKYYQFFA